MKTLANCSPKEFLVQTNKIRKSVENWLTITGVLEIRKLLPKLPENISPEARQKAVQEQVKHNLSTILETILEKYPEETAELLGLLCFIEPDDIENHTMKELLAGYTDIIGSPEVIGFFSSLAQLGLINITDIVNP